MQGWVLVNFRIEKSLEIFEVDDKEPLGHKKNKLVATVLKCVYFAVKFLV